MADQESTLRLMLEMGRFELTLVGATIFLKKLLPQRGLSIIFRAPFVLLGSGAGKDHNADN
ncbi:MAG TPA: hypothetical protein VH619_18135 [Verrucomicrobiae bacterium]|jgi:hypothetical protein|nr:hypothetical protein [Verrucomicrobiae bacterium]